MAEMRTTSTVQRRPIHSDRRGLAWWLAVAVCKPILVVLRRPDWREVAGIPRVGGAVLAANHVSHLDPLLVAEMVLAEGRVPRFLARDSLFTSRSWAGGSVPPATSRSTASRDARGTTTL